MKVTTMSRQYDFVNIISLALDDSSDAYGIDDNIYDR